MQEFETFVERYPNSALLPRCGQKLREARDRLSTLEYQVGVFYFKQRWYPGAIDRLQALLKDDPGFTSRDGAVLLPRRVADEGEARRRGAALYDKLLAEFERASTWRRRSCGATS